ncbi:AraC family transcriptional regulator [Acinetobacter gyllenbergii]|uniref:AraC family transcriptional regulator n=1 Tax=Acinetobacter gyllenbergii TaxID=134534 RepID=UPI0021CF99D8|nr:AraC family transcriptional regulator [Acinetobacter gyllenbergii]MCU4580453.1 AraC family transcriptional regulator [Acinetobacter gyllenbergii]
MYASGQTNDLVKILAHKVDGLVQIEDFQTEISGFSLHRRIAKQSIHCIYGLGLGIVLQGQKEVLIRDNVYRYGAGQSMLTTIDLPAISRVTQASYQEPFLGMMLSLDLNLIIETVQLLDDKIKLKNLPAFSIENLDLALVNALTRLVDLIEEPKMIDQLAPIIKQEIVLRLLVGQHGVYLRNLVKASVSDQHVFNVIHWLRNNFLQENCIQDAFEQAHMSAATLRNHFKQITGMTPLQYQKQLRLQEARKLILSQAMNMQQIADRVGYESQSQFTREYSRLFGSTPSRDLQ